jgi:hypothetical protein
MPLGEDTSKRAFSSTAKHARKTGVNNVRQNRRTTREPINEIVGERREFRMRFKRLSHKRSRGLRGLAQAFATCVAAGKADAALVMGGPQMSLRIRNDKLVGAPLLVPARK